MFYAELDLSCLREEDFEGRYQKAKRSLLGLNSCSGVSLEFFLQQRTCFRFAEPFKRCQYLRKIFNFFLVCFIFVCDALG